jgi:hypothetical protein
MVLQYSEILHLFLLFLIFFIAHFLLVENTYKNPYSLKAVKRHPSIQKGKNETPRTYRGKRESSFR